MKRLSIFVMILIFSGLTMFGCAIQPRDQGWVTLIDGGKGLENLNVVGDANWRVEGDAIVADKGKGGFLVSKDVYTDFAVYAEFWAESDTNSGIFMRASNPTKINPDNAYEVNIWDIRPDPIYATGAIVNFAAVPVPTVHKAGGKWNTLEVSARGTQLTVKFNGIETVNIQNSKYASGPFALQYGAGIKGATGGAIKWRKVQVKPL